MNRLGKRLLASLTIATMITAGVPASVFAEEEGRIENEQSMSEISEEIVPEDENVSEEKDAGSQEIDTIESSQTAEQVSNLEDADLGYQYFIDSDVAVITGYTGNETFLEIPDELDGYIVSEIADSAFARNELVEEVAIPDSVKKIGKYAFDGCTGLKEIVLNNGIETLGRSFLRNTEVTELMIPKTVINADNALSGTKSLVKVTFEEGIEKIPDDILREYYTDEAVGVTEAVIPDSVREIGRGAFGDCGKLEGIVLPEGLEVIGDAAFSGCDALSEISFPESLQKIGNSAFAQCIGLTEVEIPEKTAEIGRYAFDGCTSLKKVVLNDGTETLGRSFLRNTEVTELMIPKTVINADNALSGTKSLVKVTFEEGIEKIPDDILREYYTDEAVGVTEAVIPDSVREIGRGAFGDCGKLEGIVLPEGLEVIGDAAFSGCDALSEISFPESLQKIGNSAFAQCIGLTEVEIPEKTAEIGRYAFDGCTSLKKVVLNDGTETLGRGFLRNTEVTELVIPKTVNSADYALSGAKNLLKVTFANGMKKIPDNIFRMSFNDETIGAVEAEIPMSITEVGKDAFMDFNGTLVIPSEDSVVVLYAIDYEIPYRVKEPGSNDQEKKLPRQR